MRRALVCSLLALSPAVFAATEFTDSVPLKLAQTLLRSPFGGQTHLYEDLPDNFPQLNLPTEFTLLGSVDQGITQTVVFELPEGFTDAQSIMERTLEDAGWKALPAFTSGNRNTGFVSAQQPTLPSRYCHDDATGSMNVSEASQDGTTLLLLSRQLTGALMGRMNPSCAEQIEQGQFSQGGFTARGIGPDSVVSSYLPRLEMPEPSNQALSPMTSFMGGGGGGSMNDWETQNRIVIDWSLQQMFDHFAPQLEAQGWARENSGAGSFLATSTWTKSAEDGSQLRGILNILESETNNFELKFRLIRSLRATAANANGALNQ
jgi:hypothetical protein